MQLMNSLSKRKAAFFGHICRGSSGNDVVTILEGSVETFLPTNKINLLIHCIKEIN